MTTSHTPSQHESSPFDPFLIEFLRAVRGFETGYSPTTNGKAIAVQMGVEPAFIETLTISARRRRLLEAFYAPAHRNTLRWRLSARGEAFLLENAKSDSSSEKQ